ncbi:SMEK domain-containing protein [Microcoleus sp. herbarium5]|uniref:SMEK domain-containing protein n=1 Tax=Microcoleus sp. herbarium5 TaxID=3055434 RepID=UPI002FD34BB2
MLVQEELQKKICDFLGILQYSVEYRGTIGLLDQNLIVQSLIAKFLNIIYGYDLINLDRDGHKYPAIDLGDSYRKVAFQVTATKTPRKIEETIEIFIRHKEYENFSDLKFLILGRKQNKYSQVFNTYNLFNFNPQTDILDIKDIVRQLPSLKLDKLLRLSYLIDSELSGTVIFKTTYQILHDSHHQDSLPREEVKPDNVVRTVRWVDVPLYSDPGCQQRRPDMTGVILDNRQHPENVFAGYTIHPTSPNLFKEGAQVIIVYSRNSVCDESWYRNPETNEITYAWTEHSEVIGRMVEVA